MFICIGGNDTSSKEYGVGDTIENAVREWASSGTYYIQEYNEYNPAIYEVGNPLEVELRIQFIIKE